MANAIYVEEQLLQDAEQILEKLGLDAGTIAKIVSINAHGVLNTANFLQKK